MMISVTMSGLAYLLVFSTMKGLQLSTGESFKTIRILGLASNILLKMPNKTNF